jgi:hypothetical protein
MFFMFTRVFAATDSYFLFMQYGIIILRSVSKRVVSEYTADVYPVLLSITDHVES